MGAKSRFYFQLVGIHRSEVLFVIRLPVWDAFPWADFPGIYSGAKSLGAH